MTSQAESAESSPALHEEHESPKRVRVAAWAADPITLNGLTQALMGRLDVFVATGELPADVDVLVVAADRVSMDVMVNMRRAAAQCSAPMVLVTNELDRTQLLAAVECRVVAVLHRSAATEERLVSTIDVVAGGGGLLPPNLLGDLLRQVQNLHEEVLAPRGLNSSGLTSREVDVIRLLTEGCDTEEIATRMCYSERTVKNVIYAMTSRFNLRNRPQLVAYAMRSGII
ncbi:response regulator transcription factor [Saccharopolyspora gloriosae]|uniref:DNA-binding NarL/FixJ family response regulator n=1 Tax=Saccharopolyspora gloriosae TaxID=455344 RepID=A0A840NCB7_9PSEU|nr:DNA-binding NarL/FixJ family response regulator [Saccharopolyspora gloriosae]